MCDYDILHSKNVQKHRDVALKSNDSIGNFARGSAHSFFLGLKY